MKRVRFRICVFHSSDSPGRSRNRGKIHKLHTQEKRFHGTASARLRGRRAQQVWPGTEGRIQRKYLRELKVQGEGGNKMYMPAGKKRKLEKYIAKQRLLN